MADVHLWPFWGGWEGELGRYTREHGIGFVIGLTVTACDFADPGKVQLVVEAEVDAALV